MSQAPPGTPAPANAAPEAAPAIAPDPPISPDMLQLKSRPHLSIRLNKRAVTLAMTVLGLIALLVVLNIGRKQPPSTSPSSDRMASAGSKVESARSGNGLEWLDRAAQAASSSAAGGSMPQGTTAVTAAPAPLWNGWPFLGGTAPAVIQPGAANAPRPGMSFGIPTLPPGSMPPGWPAPGAMPGTLPGAVPVLPPMQAGAAGAMGPAGAGGGAGAMTLPGSNRPDPQAIEWAAHQADTALAVPGGAGVATVAAMRPAVMVDVPADVRTSGGGLPAGAARSDGRPEGRAEGRPATDSDLNRQDQKARFLDQAAETAARSPQVADAVPPRGPYELRAGAVVSAVLITGINSDLPGEVIAQVTHPVYDSATGRHLLIPQGSRLIGRYDSRINFGQERLMVAWTRLLFPDATSVDLGAMAGADDGGRAGLGGDVNNHYGRLFGMGLLMSMFTAAFQISQGNDNTVPGAVMSSRQTAAAAVGQQMTQLGIELARRQMQVQPTINVPRGQTFTVFVNRDLVFTSPYRG